MSSIKELAEEAFQRDEQLRIAGMANTPTDYEDRKKSFILMAELRARAAEATRKLNEEINK